MSARAAQDTGWTVRELAADDGVLLLRARVDLPDAAERARWPVAAWVAWSFGDAQDQATVDAMVRFEDAAYASAERDGWAVGVAVLTGGAAREWLFHAAHGQEFARELAAAAGEGPWTVRTWDDPQWRAARELVGG